MKRIIAIAGIAALLAVCLAACVDNPEESTTPDYDDHWTELETGYRPVKAMAVVSQPEIFYCGELGQLPDMRGVVFRLEYEDGGAEETEFIPARKVRSWYYECSGGWQNYGMAVRAMNPWEPPPLGKQKEAVFFQLDETVAITVTK